ncbi:helix-turn-helix transcriptional regulator [Helicobacter pametensis]|uniref:helix-turn-helix transcriptional regulator n=1 Tax=Helicobacter pametensis TaxID=95149 RepID=UPI000485F0E8|nr:WYL domain-containing protein [Helicobacter pametensis]
MSTQHTRLAKILEKLYLGETLRISSLAKEFNTSTKTIQRDLKERLGGDILLREKNQFKLNPLYQSQKDRIVLCILENLINQVEGNLHIELLGILNKLNTYPNPFQAPLTSIIHKTKEIEQIQKAIKNKLLISFSYKNQKLSRIAPINLYVICHTVYLEALVDQERHYFTLDSISECKISRQKHYTHTTPHQGERISLFIYPQARNYAQSIIWGENQETWLDKDGSLVVEFICANEDALIQAILCQIPHIIVLEPQHIKNRIEQKILAYIKKQ